MSTEPTLIEQMESTARALGCGAIHGLLKRAILELRLRALPREQAAGVQVTNLLNALDAKQAKIDALMLEFCPGEMSSAQRDEWARNQVSAGSDIAALDTSRERGEVIPCSRGDLTADDLEELVDKLCKPHGYEPSSDDLYRTQVALLYLSIRIRSAPAAASVEMERDAKSELMVEAVHLLRGWRRTFEEGRHGNSPINSTRDWLSRFDAAIAAAGEGA